MKLSQYRSSSSWLGAIELGPKLMSLAEELPASEEMGLNYQLRQLMVKLPTAIGADLVLSTNTRKTLCFRLQATLELIERVYPALDTAAVRADADSLVERMLSDEHFEAGPDTSPDITDIPTTETSTPETPDPELPAVEPSDTPLVPSDISGLILPSDTAPDAASDTSPDATPNAAPEVAPTPAQSTSIPVSGEPTP